MTIFPIACFLDNYIWCIQVENSLWVVDPGDASPVLEYLHQHSLSLGGILLTHHHADHTGGVNALLAHKNVAVYGPEETNQWATTLVAGGSTLDLPIGQAQILFVGAHTRGHIAYYIASAKALFCGDTLFSAGCGRLFEGTPEDLELALSCINSLPADTKLYPTHEYTLSNLAFAKRVEPDNNAIVEYTQWVHAQRDQEKPSLPTTLALERQVNPFLRATSATIVQQVSEHAKRPISAGLDTLASLRAWKDNFRG
ncbi:MAG: hydroxyacylglutathione hydrolase [Moraxellaceae bacterium]|nr:hydroxyacylglutathione hydrolase [Moraxellaceae bacterium]